MLYEIINMSDPYTIEARSLDVAFVACLFLGSGQYAFEPRTDTVSNAENIPMFMFGGCEEWSHEHFSESFKAVVDRVTSDAAKRMELAECFDSCLIGDTQDQETYRAGLDLIDDPTKRRAWRDKWQDDRRSSINNIGGRAYAMAKKLREGSKNPLKRAPQQVFTS